MTRLRSFKISFIKNKNYVLTSIVRRNINLIQVIGAEKMTDTGLISNAMIVENGGKKMEANDNDILLDIPEHIWQQCEDYKQCPKGWRETAKKVEAVLLAEGVKIRQMKEKFGGLRVYWDWPEEWNDLEDETFHDKCEQIELLINVADWVCQRTCMVCGENGTLYKENWINILCEEHYNEWKERLKGKM